MRTTVARRSVGVASFQLRKGNNFSSLGVQSAPFCLLDIMRKAPPLLNFFPKYPPPIGTTRPNVNSFLVDLPLPRRIINPSQLPLQPPASPPFELQTLYSKGWVLVNNPPFPLQETISTTHSPMAYRVQFPFLPYQTLITHQDSLDSPPLPELYAPNPPHAPEEPFPTDPDESNNPSYYLFHFTPIFQVPSTRWFDPDDGWTFWLYVPEIRRMEEWHSQPFTG